MSSHDRWTLEAWGCAPATPQGIALRSNIVLIFLTAVQNFRVASHPNRPKEMKVFTEAYSYQLYGADDLSKAGELLLWHWHPGEGFSEPHLHIGVGYSNTRAVPKLHTSRAGEFHSNP